ncbi:MAG: TIGR04211 family SH3 domain-containing protein [Candidatus Thiodiazotropha sp. (ex Lucina aurantia)]|uniref:TIGR04211 family SH3 domain-containing protein n=1 Tax=Candidatus Thiodiazotropha taylori TaxID=2792791 RepID=A0A9E4NLB5_9GAMM|nr:TIGR04211 family SH3 domain-containing protein [Candidatus Thiodiazotropha taylori]MBT3029579.1 TIGR04211 family SH3 domain-containing protein [Candidatus Thiodiazotropha sp. (ex Lucina pensylvanica)]MBT3041525.1 TIGR04211 family SH3 domain-containing protein [Candidatus Thiodiazotropha sp. (ex Codakia orbicularis)]MBV2102490.1 TIGR04211 family SH3 domain-containing protein [Candidatus Thiodiazotropha sp. (ex Lucina aurantia)]MCG8025890.1 TIGR04211 family SH3 domain-containing protein [Candi
MKRFTISIFCLLLLPAVVQAKTYYVTDDFKIAMRTGESIKHRITRYINTGTAVEVISTNKETGYSKVRMGTKEGFVLTRQLLSEPVARSQLETMRKEIDALKAAPGELRSNLADLQKNHRELLASHKKLQQIKDKQEQELQSIQRTASNAIRISNERNELRKQVADLTREAEELKQENRDLSNEATRDWFLIGAGVIIAGILIGLILPHLRFQRRRSSWGSL